LPDFLFFEIWRLFFREKKVFVCFNFIYLFIYLFIAFQRNLEQKEKRSLLTGDLLKKVFF